MKKIAFILIALLVIAALILMSSYNKLTKLSNNVDNSWDKVQTQYQRRADLIPRLASTAEGMAKFEKNTLVSITEARAAATALVVDSKHLTPEKLAEFQKVQTQVSTSLSRFIMVSEKYPELRANEGFLKLQDQLKGTENRVRVARNDYSDAILNYNNAVTTFPSNIIAPLLGFKSMKGYEAVLEAQKVPEVIFNQPK